MNVALRTGSVPAPLALVYLHALQPPDGSLENYPIASVGHTGLRYRIEIPLPTAG
jgi:hypothetical protein